jgi:hypothetical protein
MVDPLEWVYEVIEDWGESENESFIFEEEN